MEFTCCSANSILPPRAPRRNDGGRSVRDNVTLDRQVRRPNRERRSILPASQGRGEPGWENTVKESELLINVVTEDRQKRLICLNQTVRGQVKGLLTPLTQMLHHRRRGSTYVLREGFVRNVVSPYFSVKERSFSGKATRKESRWECGYGIVEKANGGLRIDDFTGADSVMERIGVQTLPYCKNRPTSTRSSLAKKD